MFLNSKNFQRGCYKASDRNAKILIKNSSQSVNIFLITAFAVDFLGTHPAFALRGSSVNHPPTAVQRKKILIRVYGKGDIFSLFSQTSVFVLMMAEQKESHLYVQEITN